jgi:hypothetical protein
VSRRARIPKLLLALLALTTLASAGVPAFAATAPGVRVAMPPVGLSFEYPTMAADLGSGPCPPPALVAELRRLGSPPLALAGDSQDLTAPTGALDGRTFSWESSILYSLPVGFWGQLHCLLSATGEPLTVGVNMRTAQPSWAAQMLAGAQSATTALTFSLGNEPDLYPFPNYTSLGRQPTGEEPAAVSLYLQLASNLEREIGNVPVLGPELARADHWRAELPQVIRQPHDTTVGVHLYPLSGCKDPRGVTLKGLLSGFAASQPTRLAWVVADARAAGLPAIVSEANSASCGGRAGVSDSPAAAVWAIRFVLSALKTGFQEVRFHLSGGAYDPFLLSGGQVLARPLESALVTLNRWLPIGATLQSLAAGKHAAGTQLIASVIREPSGARLLIFDNERPRAQTVLLPGAAPVLAELFSPARAGARTLVFRARRGRLRLRVPGDSLLAVQA